MIYNDNVNECSKYGIIRIIKKLNIFKDSRQKSTIFFYKKITNKPFRLEKVIYFHTFKVRKIFLIFWNFVHGWQKTAR